MLASLLLNGWVAMAATWTPLKTLSITCTGTQTAYQENNPVKQTLPWQETFSVDLVGGTYCSTQCSTRTPLSALTNDGLDLENSSGQFGSSLKRFHAATGAIESNLIVAASPTDRFHVEQAGTCKISPVSSGS